MIYFFLVLMLMLFTVPFYIITNHYRALSTGTSQAEEDVYISYVDFASNIRMLIKYYLKKLYRFCNFATHYVEFLFIKLVSLIQSAFEGLYKKMISRFLESSISNRAYVKFFWKDLKRFKKEIDSESEV